ncbi:hypothetical protein F2Q69_00027656 [Brassica cretica]|uniref:Uncharacterized protein n=1 Tax=Brassica cretica TaxID=69181 RepID=A0A8S9SD35_BRACR|nr:hypothetical protein F2Q69_00027656 [Brassica cretica]
MGATSRSDAMRSLQTTSQSDLAGATPRSHSPFHPGGSRKLTRNDLSERPLQVTPEAQSDLARVTPRGRSRFYRVTTTQWSQSDLSERPTKVIIGRAKHGSDITERRHEVAPNYLSERPRWSDPEKSLAISSRWKLKTDPERPIRATTPGRSRSPEQLGQSDTPRSLAFLSRDDNTMEPERPTEVAPEAWSDLSERRAEVAPEAQSDLARVTPRGRSHFYRVTTTQWSRSDLSERPTEVAPEARSDVPRSLCVYLFGQIHVF